jgi:glycosyltransferase involved in cell wall biosynthesis
MNIHVYAMAHNEELLMPFFLRHYKKFSNKIIIFDNESTDKTASIALSSGANVIAVPTDNKLMDSVLTRIKNEEYKKSIGIADWVIIVDIDEFLYHPQFLSVLEEYKNAGVTLPRVIGYEMVSSSLPVDRGQDIYEDIKIGFNNELYNKHAIFNPELDICYGIGSHSCKPKGRIVKSPFSDIKLLHYRFLGIDYIKSRWEIRKRRISEENVKNSWGTVPTYFSEIFRWFDDAKKKNRLRKIVPSSLKKVHFGCGGNVISSWENHDKDVDLRKPLPYKDNSIDFIFAEHTVEHLFQREAWLFLSESFRVLKRGGVIRIIFPDITKIKKAYSEELRGTPNKFEENYLKPAKARGWSDGSIKSSVRGLIFNWEHQSMWTSTLFMAVLESIGFHSYERNVSESSFDELQGIEGHWKAVGKEYDSLESSVVEGIKL